MKEKDLIKSATDKQMPDLEQIRQNILNQSPQVQNQEQEQKQEQKPKILSLKPSKLIAVAAVAALAVIGTIAAVANQNGGFFAPKPEETTTESTVATESTAPATRRKPVVKKNKAPVKRTVIKRQKENRINKYIKRLNKNGFNVTWLYDLGKIDGYHIVYAGNNNTSNYKCDYIMGSYTFHTKKQQSPYGLGLYACGEDKSVILSDAYEEGIYKDFSDVVDTITDFDEKDIGIEIQKDNPTSNMFIDYFGGKDILSIAKVKSTVNYELFFNIASSYNKSNADRTIDNYTFHLDGAQEPYELGLYVLADGKLQTLEEALDSEILNMDKVYKAVHAKSEIPYNFGLFINEDEEDENIEETTVTYNEIEAEEKEE